MRVREFKIEDWAMIKDPVEPFTSQTADPTLFAQCYGVTITDGDTILGCGGIVPDKDDRAYIWLRLSSMAAMTTIQAISVIYIIKECFSIIRSSFDYEEYYSFVLDDFDKGKKFAKLMGFDICGIEVFNNKKYRLVRYRNDWS